MAGWRITRYPPIAGPHSLGDDILTFDTNGVAFTDNEATMQRALEFPTTFTVLPEAVGAGAHGPIPDPERTQGKTPPPPAEAPRATAGKAEPDEAPSSLPQSAQHQASGGAPPVHEGPAGEPHPLVAQEAHAGAKPPAGEEEDALGTAPSQRKRPTGRRGED